ncbi:DinB family protein [Glaciecola sp. SC05]|uniref:DinB family protein n=1 Tax=Glaciecola sp. SC05 TaxID=1987355 RepID=UPI003528BEE2
MPNSYTDVVNQAISLLDDLSNNEYQTLITPHFASSIGAHIRHIIDHFLALQDGLAKGHINYNVRHRHNQTEKFVDIAVQALHDINQWLSNLDEAICQQTILVTSEIDISHTKSSTCSSTLERELVFVSSHAIHHYALIRIMCSMQNISVPDFFGYAPATITHINRSA